MVVGVDEFHHGRVLRVGGGAEVAGGFVQHEVDGFVVAEDVMVQGDMGEAVDLALAVGFDLLVDADASGGENEADGTTPLAGVSGKKSVKSHRELSLTLGGGRRKLEMMKRLRFAGMCGLLAGLLVACAPSGGGGASGTGSGAGAEPAAAPWKDVEVRRSATAAGGQLQAKVDGHEVVAMLKWRPYNPAVDGSVSQWYGDMGSPPPAFVVDSLQLSVDGRGVRIAKSQYRYLCAKTIHGVSVDALSLNQQGKKLRLLVDVGDGGEGWTAVYEFDPSKGALLSHRVGNGVEVHEQILP